MRARLFWRLIAADRRRAIEAEAAERAAAEHAAQLKQQR